MAKVGKYKDAKFENSLQLIRPALEWAEKQDVERLSQYLLESANIPLYCFSSGGSSASNDYLALLYESNRGMAKSLTPLAMASISDEALKTAKIIITSSGGHGCDEEYTVNRAAEVNPQGVCGITSKNDGSNVILNTLKGITNNWYFFNTPRMEGFIGTDSIIAMFGLFYRAFTKERSILDKLEIDLSPNHCFTYAPRVEGHIPRIKDLKNFIVLQSGWSRPVAQDFESKMVESGIASVQLCDYRNYCHGRFVFLSRHMEESVLVLFITPREKDYAKRLILEAKTYRGNRDVFPMNTPIIIVETELDNPLASIDLLIKTQVLFNEVAKACSLSKDDDPCNPDNPRGINKEYPRSLVWGKMSDLKGLNNNILPSTRITKGGEEVIKMGTLRGVNRKKFITYDPSKTIQENADANEVEPPTIWKYIRDKNIDRQRDERMNTYNNVWQEYIKDSDISIAKLARSLKLSENTVKYYLTHTPSDLQPKVNKIGLVVENPTVKELRESIPELRGRFEKFQIVFAKNPTLTADELLKKLNWSANVADNVKMANAFIQMKEFKYRFKKGKIEWITTEKPQETAIPEATEPQEPKPKETPTRKKKVSQEVRNPSDALEGVDEELRKKLKRAKIKSLEELYEKRNAILEKEKERVAEYREVYAKAKPLTWDDFSFRKTHTYDTSKVDCWSFNSFTDVRNGISLNVGNMSGEYGVSILGIDFKNSEVPYQLAIFKNDEASIAVQKEVANPSNPLFSNGYRMKNVYIKKGDYAPYRRDTQFENGKEMWCYEWMKWVVWEKVKQNKGFRDILLSIPQKAVIIEQAQRRKQLMWGCWNEELKKEREILKLAAMAESGLSDISPKVKNAIYQVNCASKWVGENAMGQILTMAKLALNEGVQMPIDTKMLNDAKICWFGDVLVFTEQKDGSVTVEAKPIDTQDKLQEVIQKPLMPKLARTKVTVAEEKKVPQEVRNKPNPSRGAVKGIIGAVIGDIVGSRFEFLRAKNLPIPKYKKLFATTCTFTDDSALTLAIADALLHKREFRDTIWEYGHRYPNAGFGNSFKNWLKGDKSVSNNSIGNGCGMRVSPIGFHAKTLDEALELAKESAIISHNSEEGIRGAQSIAAATFLAKQQTPKEEIKSYIEKQFGYNLDQTDEEIEAKVVKMTKKGEREFAENTCPLAIIAFLVTDDYESSIRKSISYSCDTDTVACMCGGISAAYYGVPQEIVNEAADFLPQELLDIINEFDGLQLSNHRTTPSTYNRWGDILVYGSSDDQKGEVGAPNISRYFEGKPKVTDGLSGRAYAIPTVGKSLKEIKEAVNRFCDFAKENQDKTFLITKIGCAERVGYAPIDIAPMFAKIADLPNVYLPKDFREVLNEKEK